ncbi:unnamed protein product [Adineta steineri]|uniref:Uncharacterized protein n=1 Tax=Adineta steineri TaxID=433720 RepID=A0A813PLT5_9BILA|nr:unnamed protein product [Adineta steineri]CAF0828132.1 unnamed protein product [Adineta steineri]CAF3609283.1 unnamed protein product [Adineta steineri]CAF3616132.1 unnamed protein product [Adineta steineri]CAF4175816.1 unnamed protein product [Adineta steineri]
MAGPSAIIKYLNANDIQAYITEVVNNASLFQLIHEAFQLKFDLTRGLTKNEIPDLIDSISDPDVKQTLKGVRLLGESKANMTIDQKTGSFYKKALVAYVQRNDGKYDVLVVYATQTKQLDYDKVAACGVGAVCMGVLAGFLTVNPWIGITVGACTAAASGAKGAYDYSKPVPDVLCGFMLHELVRQKILTVLPNNDVQLAIK